MSLRTIYADFHIHIGRSSDGTPIKISGSRDLTFYHIAKEASDHKGIELIGIIDCHSPPVQSDIIRYLEAGTMEQLTDGGIRYRNTTILLGCEFEIKEEGRGPAHLLAYFPDLASMQSWTTWLTRHVTNITLSSQRVHAPALTIQQEVIERGGLLIPAHIFTPYKSLYGSCTDRIEDILDPSKIAAVELGLSADTSMAGTISELDAYPFLTNSDAHSLKKIGREYNSLQLKSPTFEEWKKALTEKDGRKIKANYGLNPLLGKYHQTACAKCGFLMNSEREAVACPHCGSIRMTTGVARRIKEIADRERPSLENRPPYHYQLPLEFIPGLGPKMLSKLLDHFATEMNILHHVPIPSLEEVAGAQISKVIEQARQGKLSLQTGGGGFYGKVKKK